ncbi:MAG: tetratricopeptide repeat protein, partial [bacterium]|nr:tetratricopeptide repeat protein [bacterium]
MKTKKTSLILILTMVGLFLSNTEMFAQQAADQLYEKALYLEEAKGQLQDAINIYNKIVETRDADQSVKAKALLHMGLCYEKLGMKEATKAYQRLVNTCPDQTEMVALAKARLAALGGTGGTGGVVTRRVLADASGAGGALPVVLTADGKYINHIDNNTGDVIQFEVASGQSRRITNMGPWSKTERLEKYQAFSRDGKQIAYDSYTKDVGTQLRIRNLDGSGLRTLYSEKDSYFRPLDWS